MDPDVAEDLLQIVANTSRVSLARLADLEDQWIIRSQRGISFVQSHAIHGAPGIDGLTVEAAESCLHEHWTAVCQSLLEGTLPTPVVAPKGHTQAQGRGLKTPAFSISPRPSIQGPPGV